MMRLLPFLVELALLVFCLVDCAQSPNADVRNLPKWAWLLLIIIFPLIGSIAWLIAGRPQRRSTTTWSQGSGFPEVERPVADTQDIDERLAAELERVDREHEEMVRRHQADVERRQREAEPDGGDATS